MAATSLKPKLSERQFEIKIADGESDLRAAQRLRYQVFVEELGATGPTVDHKNKLEIDKFDPFYDHLLLVDPEKKQKKHNHVVGVYRLMRSEVAAENNGFYSAAEYDLSPLLNSGKSLLELGRSCVASEFRGGTAMYRLWNALAEYVLRHRIDVLFGVASYHGTDMAAIAQSLSYLHHEHLAPPDARVSVRPEYHNSLNLIPKSEVDVKAALAQTPPLIKAYLRLGGKIGRGAYIDRDFNTVDVCLLMDTAIMSEKHKKAYTRRGEGSK